MGDTSFPYSNIVSVLLMQMLVPVRQAGLPVEALCSKAGIDPAWSLSPDIPVPVARIYALYEEVVRHTGNEYFWLHAVTPALFPPENLQFYIVFQARTLGELVDRGERLYRYFSDDFCLSGLVADDRFWIRYHFPWPDEQVSVYRLDWLMAMGRCIVEMFAGRPVRPEVIHLPQAFSARAGEYERYYDAPVVTGRAHIEFGHPLASRDLPNARMPHDPALDSILSRQVERSPLGRQAVPRFLVEFRGLLQKRLRDGTPELQEVASDLAMSARSLQRKLAELNTGFSAELHELRNQLARQYLADPAISVMQTGYLLGFRDARSFTVAFQKWNGVTPSEYRKRHKQESPSCP